MTQLRITVRCLVEDLGFTRADASRPLEELDHPIVAAFRTKRAVDPAGAEKVQPLTSRRVVYTLHGQRFRGATWHDVEDDVCWLLGAGFHTSGDADDVYPHLKSLDEQDRLMPEAEDYELFYQDQELTFATALLSVQAAVDAAEARPGEDIGFLLGDRIPLRIMVEEASGVRVRWVSMSYVFVPGGLEIPSEWQTTILAAVFPEVRDPMTEVSVAETWADGTRNPRVSVFTWYRETF